MLGCTSQQCGSAAWFPSAVASARVLEDSDCPQCSAPGAPVRRLKLKLPSAKVPPGTDLNPTLCALCCRGEILHLGFDRRNLRVGGRGRRAAGATDGTAAPHLRAAAAARGRAAVRRRASTRTSGLTFSSGFASGIGSFCQNPLLLRSWGRRRRRGHGRRRLQQPRRALPPSAPSSPRRCPRCRGGDRPRMMLQAGSSRAPSDLAVFFVSESARWKACELGYREPPRPERRPSRRRRGAPKLRFPRRE